MYSYFNRNSLSPSVPAFKSFKFVKSEIVHMRKMLSDVHLVICLVLYVAGGGGGCAIQVTSRTVESVN